MARCNLRRLLCLPNQQFCLHCYCSHQTLQMYISDITPPLQDRSHMAVLSSGWWSCIWIFYVSKVNNICNTLESLVESWIYSNKDGAVVTCSLIQAYQSHPRGSVDGLISRGGICLVIMAEAAEHPAGTAVMCHLCSVLPLTPSALFGYFQHLHQTFLLFSFATPPCP